MYACQGDTYLLWTKLTLAARFSKDPVAFRAWKADLLFSCLHSRSDFRYNETVS